MKMGSGTLTHQHQQLLSRFDSVTRKDNEHLRKLDDCFSRFQGWGEKIGVRFGALEVLEQPGNDLDKAVVKSFDGIYIRLRVINALLKDGGQIHGER